MELIMIGFFIACLLSLGLTPLVKKFAIKIGAVDVPNARKVHVKLMPRLGGLAIFFAVILAFLFLLPWLPERFFNERELSLIKALFTGGAIITGLGALDDRHELSAKVKFIVQFIVAAIVVFGFGIKVESLSIPFGGDFVNVDTWVSIPLTILWIVGVTNAVNLIDGLDGLAAGVSGVSITTILTLAFFMGNTTVLLIGVLLLGSILGFLFFNFHPAKIFMGDSGSLFLGFSLAMLSMFGFKQVAIVSFLTPMLIIGVPLSDTFFAILRRWIHRKPIFAPDKHHLHHRLGELGFSHRQTVLIIYAIAAFFGLLAVVQSLAALHELNWVTFIIVAILVILLQLGAEIVGVVGETRRPLLNMLRRVHVKVGSSGTRPKP